MKADYAQLAETLLKSGNYVKVPVIGGSMSPIMKSGDSIFAKPAQALTVGDIVLYKRAGGMVAHRLIGISLEAGGRVFLTKGDAFAGEDYPVPERDIVGKVYAVERAGRVFNLDKGIFRLASRAAFLLAPVTSRLLEIKRKCVNFASSKRNRAGSREEALVLAALRAWISGRKLPLRSKPGSGPAFPDFHGADAAKVLKIAAENKVAQALYLALKEFGDLPHGPPPSLLRELGRRYVTTSAKNALLYAEFKRVAGALADLEIDVLVMKGAALAELVYGDIGAREMADVDLLVKRRDLERLDAALGEMGYRAEDRSPFDALENCNGYLATRDYRGGQPARPSFHVHWHMVNSSIPAPYARKVDMDEIWGGALAVEIGGARTLCMAPHHFLVHLCEHAMRATHSAARLIYLLDVAAIMARWPALDWRKAVEAARRSGTDGFMYGILSLGKAKIGLAPPGWVMEELGRRRRGIGERVFFSLAARGYAVPGLSYLVHLDMNKGILKKTIFISRTLFPPSWVLIKRASLPGGEPVTPSMSALCRLYASRFGEVIVLLAAFPLRFAKKAGRALIACVLALSFVLYVPVGALAAVRDSTYSMESGTPEYLIAPGDILEVSVWSGFEEKKYEVTVRPDGLMTVGFVDVKVGDCTVRQAEDTLRKALLPYFKEPRVEVYVKQYRGRTVSLFGAVRAQAGQYALKGKTTLTQLIIMAGGFAKDADIRNIRITKADGSTESVNAFQMVTFGGEDRRDVTIDGGDTVYVPSKQEEENNVFVFGEVNSPGAYKISPGLTLIQALGLAKGYKKDAILDEVRIIRTGAAKPQLIVVNARAILEGGDLSKDIPLQENDIIFVPRSRIGDWNAFLAKIRPSLEFLILPFGGALIMRELFKSQ